jgi:hypothetical protein
MQQLTWELRAFSAMKETFILTADGYGTFAMKWMPVCRNTTTAAGFLSERAIDTTETASRINYAFLVILFCHFKPR